MYERASVCNGDEFYFAGSFGDGVDFFINHYVLSDENSLAVGMNLLSFLTSGTLGIPGVCLLYGILFYRTL